RPVTNRLEIDTDHRGQLIAARADHRRIPDVGAEFQPVFDIVGNEALASRGADDFGDAAEHNQMAVILNIARIARMQPAIADRLGCRLGVVEIAIEDAGGPDQDFAIFLDLHLYPWQRASDGVQAHFVRRLDRIEGAVLGLAVKLAQFDPERTVEDEGILPHRLAAGKGMGNAGQAELVLDRPEDDPFAEPAPQPFKAAALALAFELVALRRDRAVHEH